MSHTKPAHQALQLLPGCADEAPAAERRRRLGEFCEAMNRAHAFRKGQLVRWKPGLRNRALPAHNEVAVVRDVLATPVFERCDESKCSGNPLFREPLTLVLGVLDADGDLLEFHYDGRRFEPADL